MKKSFETLKTEVRKGETYYITLHLHSYCRLFFQSRVYNTHFAEIRPHSCELATHVICGSVVTQLCSETLKLRLSENEASQPRNLKKKAWREGLLLLANALLSADVQSNHKSYLLERWD